MLSNFFVNIYDYNSLRERERESEIVEMGRWGSREKVG
jgi:hypothetical protein